MNEDTSSNFDKLIEEYVLEQDNTNADPPQLESKESTQSGTIDIATTAHPENEQVTRPVDIFHESQKSLKKNHPKNAIGYALAVAYDGDTQEIFREYVIKSVRDAQHDATTLGLIRCDGDKCRLTPEGFEAVDSILTHYPRLETALEAIKSLTGSRSRLIDSLPVIGEQLRLLMLQHQSTKLLINTLVQFDNILTLAQLAKGICKQRPRLGVRMFVSSRDEARERAFIDPDQTQLDLSAFDTGLTYATHTTFQYKAVLYHLGILTNRGIDTISDINPTTEIWKLDQE